MVDCEALLLLLFVVPQKIACSCFAEGFHRFQMLITSVSQLRLSLPAKAAATA